MIIPNDKLKVLKLKLWLKKLGMIGFLFFLIKGLAWIGVAVFAWWKLQ